MTSLNESSRVNLKEVRESLVNKTTVSLDRTLLEYLDEQKLAKQESYNAEIVRLLKELQALRDRLKEKELVRA